MPDSEELTPSLTRLYRTVLEGPSEDIEALMDVQKHLRKCMAPEELVRAFTSELDERLQAPRCIVFVKSVEDSCFTHVGGTQDLGSKAARAKSHVTPDEPLYEAILTSSRESIQITDTDTDAIEWIKRTYPTSSQPDALVFYPLTGMTETLGFLAVDTLQGTLPHGHALLALLTRQAGMLLENLLLYEKSRPESQKAYDQQDTDKQISDTYRLDAMIGSSPSMQQIFQTIRTVAGVDVPVLVVGETGTGKELVAQALHANGPRSGSPFISVNCAAMPSELVESELFGHEKGAFTGAQQQRIGKVETAEGGTLFLDEISEMPEVLQAKLLRFLQERAFERVGGSATLQANVRIIAATNRDVETAVSQGILRMDLVFRLNTITLELPPLRERREDIPLLVDSFISAANENYGRSVKTVDPGTLVYLVEYRWPGNVRELRNVIDRAVIFSPSDVLNTEAVQLATGHGESDELVVESQEDTSTEKRSLTEAKRDVVAQFERAYIDRLLRQCGGNISQAAKMAGIDKKNLFEKMRRYDLARQDYVK